MKAEGRWRVSGGKFETVAVGSGKRAFRVSARCRRVLFTPGAVPRDSEVYYPWAPARASECRGAAVALIHNRYGQYKAKAARGKGWVERGCQVWTRMQELEW